MAIQFDESTDYYEIADDAALTLGDEDWCIGIWTRVADNTGSSQQFIYNTGTPGAANSMALRLREASVGSPDTWRLTVEDGSSNNTTITSSSSPGGDGVDRLIICQRNTGSSQFEMFFCEQGGTAASQGTASDASNGATNGGVWNIGRETTGDSTRYYGGIAGEFFMGKFNLSSDDITALGNGARIDELGKSPVVYLPMPTAGHTQVDLFNSNDGTENGTPVTAEHFKVGLPKVSGVTRDAAAGSTGSGALASDDAALVGVGFRTAKGTGTLSSDDAALVGVGTRPVSGSGTLASDDAALVGVGERVVQGTGVLASDDATLVGAGTRIVFGTGVLTSDDAFLFGTDAVAPTGGGLGRANLGSANLGGAGLGSSNLAQLMLFASLVWQWQRKNIYGIVTSKGYGHERKNH